MATSEPDLIEGAIESFGEVGLRYGDCPAVKADPELGLAAEAHALMPVTPGFGLSVGWDADLNGTATMHGLVFGFELGNFRQRSVADQRGGATSTGTELLPVEPFPSSPMSPLPQQ